MQGMRPDDLLKEGPRLSSKAVTYLQDIMNVEYLDELLDRRFGIVRSLSYDNTLYAYPFLHLFRVAMPNPSILTKEGKSYHFGEDYKLRASGAGFDFKTALVTAICEAIERYCSANYCERIVTVATPEELDGPHIDFSDLNYYTHQRSLNPDWEYTDFDSTKPRGWLKGKNLSTNADVWIPAELVYLTYRSLTDYERFSQGFSTGLACGPDWETAALTGLMEVLERDASMSTWLLQKPLNFSHPFAQKILEKRKGLLENQHWKIHIGFDQTDHMLPCATAVMEATSGKGFIISSAASVNAERAAEKSLREVLKSYFGAVAQWRGTTFKQISLAEEIGSLTDHRSFYTDQPNDNCIGFLFPEKHKKFPDLVEMKPDVSCVARYLSNFGINSYAVDITLPEIRKLNLRVVRVLAPGVQPLWAGEKNRVLNLQRLQKLADGSPISAEALNKNPSPFA
jgi:ribosomal protein S12 methylthiotransferase accessory factor